MNPTDPNFLKDVIDGLLSNAGGLLIGALLVMVIIIAISMSGCVHGKQNKGGDDGPNL